MWITDLDAQNCPVNLDNIVTLIPVRTSDVNRQFTIHFYHIVHREYFEWGFETAERRNETMDNIKLLLNHSNPEWQYIVKKGDVPT